MPKIMDTNLERRNSTRACVQQAFVAIYYCFRR